MDNSPETPAYHFFAVSLGLRLFLFLLLVCFSVGAQVFPYRDCLFPAWHKISNPEKSIYFDIQRAKIYKIRWIQWNETAKKYVIYCKWEMVQCGGY
jgi:hypothetical protein